MQKIFLIICFLVFATGITAQQKNTMPEKCAHATSLFVGTVIDANQGVIPDATIYVQAKNDKNKTTELHSDLKGQFKICLPEGTYEFLVSVTGFKKYLLQDYKMNGSVDAKYEFQLEIGQCNDCEFDMTPKSGAKKNSRTSIAPERAPRRVRFSRLQGRAR